MEEEILIYLHALSEVFNEFVNTNKTFKQCALEYNCLDKIGEIFKTSICQIVLNNFCEQKDEHFENTNNDDYVIDELSAFDFKYVKILNENKYSHKKIIKEIRDGIEHLSHTIEDNKIIINNKKTNFKAEIDITFFFTSFFYHYDARKYNSFLFYDKDIEYDKGFINNVDKINLYRLIAKNKHDIRNLDYNKFKNIKELNTQYLNEEEYIREKRNIDLNQIELLKEYFLKHEFNRDNLRFALITIMLDGNEFSNTLNLFIILLLKELSSKLEKEDFTYNELINDKTIKDNILKTKIINNNEYINIFPILKNYFKIQFIKYYYQNKINKEEDIHIRNCLCHGRYTKTSSKKIIFKDHLNNIKNENTSTYYAMYDIEELYNNVKDECFINPKYYFKK
ncbi:MAG: hypothetical protein IJZ36_04760 [Bacilli bacterium]|nr:hypothetical protein [Bacilli bacterium]